MISRLRNRFTHTHIRSLSLSESIHANGFDTMRVRYAGIPTSSISTPGSFEAEVWSHELGCTLRRDSTASKVAAGGLEYS